MDVLRSVRAGQWRPREVPGPAALGLSVMVAYAVLRLRGHDRSEAAALVLRYRKEAVLVPAYVYSVEQWLAAT